MLTWAIQHANAFFFAGRQSSSSYIFSLDELLFDQKIQTKTLAIWRSKLISCKSVRHLSSEFYYWNFAISIYQLSTHTTALWVHGCSIDRAIWTGMIEPVMAFDIICFSMILVRLPPLSFSPSVRHFSPDSYRRVVSAWISIWFDHKSCERHYVLSHYVSNCQFALGVCGWGELWSLMHGLYVIDCLFDPSLATNLPTSFIFTNRISYCFSLSIYCSL